MHILSIATRLEKQMQRLLDTTDRSDAKLCGYDAPTDPRNEAEGVILTRDGEWFTLLTGGGEVQLHEIEARQIAVMILGGALAQRVAA
jgi:hypothetical protein